MLACSRRLTLLVLCLLGSAVFAAAQDPAASPTPTPTPEASKVPPITQKDIANKTLNADQVVESAIVVYGFPSGRATLNQIRKTSIERGHSTIPNTAGKMQQIAYERRTMRSDNLEKEKIRLDQEYPNERFAMVYSDERIFGLLDNGTEFAPRDDAAHNFENQIFRGLEAFLRYKENGSVIELAGKDKVMGVDFYMIDVTDKLGRKTRFYVSTKSFRVMMLEYEDAGVKYRRKFYNYNYAQGTLVPYRSGLWAGDTVVAETEINTSTFGQKVDEDIFRAG